MEEAWKKLKDWLAINAPDQLKYLNPPATDEDIAKFEAAFGVPMTKDMIAFYKVHNGEDSGFFFKEEELLSIDRMISEWSIWKELYDKGEFDEIKSEPEKGIKNDWWNPLWIPLTYDGSGNHDCIDFDPAEGGKKGQIIRMWHDDESRESVATSFKKWFTTYVEDITEWED